jgi:hypothetical protein
VMSSQIHRTGADFSFRSRVLTGSQVGQIPNSQNDYMRRAQMTTTSPSFPRLSSTQRS